MAAPAFDVNAAGAAAVAALRRGDAETARHHFQQIVDSGAATYGLAIESGSGSGGGWYIEQWFANQGELYADNGNGRLAPATRVLYDGPAGVELLTYVQSLIADGLAVYVGDNAGGQGLLCL